MQIISHRGYWLHKPERNLTQAFHRSFDFGFGTETTSVMWRVNS